MGNDDRGVSWVGTISEQIVSNPPREFLKEELLNQDDLFAHRCALFYTRTINIPKGFVGSDELDILLPIPTPDYSEIFELKSYRTPRFWVDLIQRQTFKLRWQPARKARVEYTRFDYYKIRSDHFTIGTKALTDALKEKTTGRSNGKYLYYFGAIMDDGPDYIEVGLKQELVEHPKDSGIRVHVIPLA